MILTTFSKLLQLIFILTLYVIIRIPFILVKLKKGNSLSLGKEILTSLLVIYTLYIMSVTLLPTFYGTSDSSFLETIKRINWIPFYSEIKFGFIFDKYFFLNFLGNLFLLTPIVGYFCCYNKKIRNIKSILIFSFLVSLSIETIQLIENLFISTSRSVDATDLLLNTISSLIGYSLFLVLYKTRLSNFVQAK